MAGRLAGAAVVATTLASLVARPLADRPSGFDALAPDVQLTPASRVSLGTGAPLVQVSSYNDGLLSLAGIVRVDVTAERLMQWAENVEGFYRGKYVPQIGRFSATPRLEDLRGLTVERSDLDELAACAPADCGVKVSRVEMQRLKGRSLAAVNTGFRQLLVSRATDYLAHGHRCAPPYDDHRTAVAPLEATNALMQRFSFLRRSPALANAFDAPPAGAGMHDVSILYWSKEHLGMKPITGITHLAARRMSGAGLPEAVIVTRQVYASHYKNASITVTALVHDNGTRFLVYLHRSQIDAFDGLVGRMIRRTVESRVRREAPGVLTNLRQRLETGDPLPR